MVPYLINKLAGAARRWAACLLILHQNPLDILYHDSNVRPLTHGTRGDHMVVEVPSLTVVDCCDNAGDGDAVTYEVRFGPSNPPPTVVSSQSATAYDPPGNMAAGVTHYWQIVAKDAFGGATAGPVWSFSTAGGATFPDVFYVSPAANVTIAGVAYTGSDILKYTRSTNTWAMFFDGSDVGVTKNVSAFAFLPGGDLLLSFAANQPLAGLGTFAPHDVARFYPMQTGLITAGTFSWRFDGSDVGLSTTGEKIDALDALADGRLLISTTGALSVPVLGKQQDEDVIAFTPTGVGATTTGSWAAYFDGSTVTGLAAEDVNAFWLDETTGDRYLAIVGAFNLGGVAGNGKSLVKLPAGSNTPSLVLYDDVPGGAGHVRRVAEAWWPVFAAALERVARCGCGPETACHECLWNYYNEPFHAVLSRGLAEGFLRGALGV